MKHELVRHPIKGRQGGRVPDCGLIFGVIHVGKGFVGLEISINMDGLNRYDEWLT